MTSHDLQSLSGIGPATARTLVAAGFVDRDAIASATVEQLVAVRGFAEARASALIAEARSSVGNGDSSDTESPATMVEEARDQEEVKRSKLQRKGRKKKLRARHADLKKRAKKAGKKSKTASTKKKRKRWAAEADRLAKKAKKAKKRLSRV